MRGGHGLVHRAADALRDGPVHTLDLARDVLRVRGHAGAASAAIFSLLGADARFRVDGQGFWSLAPGADHLGRPLGALRYAVVDVETTGGGHGSGHRVIEIAIVEVSGGAIVDEWRSLVNPGRGIPYGVQNLTGITPGMVAVAPYFEHLADEVAGRLEGRVFVAHNVAFDWRFVSQELGRAGNEVPRMHRLCTVRMARRLVPGLRRRNLDALTRHFGVPVHGRHRAYGDALATARVLLRMLDEAQGRGVGDLEALQRYLRRSRRRKTARAAPELFDVAAEDDPGSPGGNGRGRGAP